MEKLNLSLDEIIKISRQEARNKKNSEYRNDNLKRNFNENPINRKFYNNKYNNNIQTKNINYNHKKGSRFENQYKTRRNYVNQVGNNSNENYKCRLIVSNLHYNVMNDELHTIFSAFGKLKRSGIHWDRAGISKGTADIEYLNSIDCKRALEFLNGSEFEGQKIKIEYKN